MITASTLNTMAPADSSLCDVLVFVLDASPAAGGGVGGIVVALIDRFPSPPMGVGVVSMSEVLSEVEVGVVEVDVVVGHPPSPGRQSVGPMQALPFLTASTISW
jgi:hypothetical protein